MCSQKQLASLDDVISQSELLFNVKQFLCQTVAYIGSSGAYGKLIIIEHPGNYRTYYAHLSNFNNELLVGNAIRRGMEIGYVGSTGRSTGPHLHYELRKNGIYVDPYNPKIQLDLWSMRPNDSGQFTKLLLLLGNIDPE